MRKLLKFMTICLFVFVISAQIILSTDAVPPVSEIRDAQVAMFDLLLSDMEDDGYVFAKDSTMKLSAISDKLSHEHEFVKFRTVLPTCETVGYTIYGCRCGDREIADEVCIVDHDWGRWVVTEEPTVKTVGSKEKTCNWCGIAEQGTIERLFRGENHVGRFVIQSVGVNVGLFQQYGDEGGPIVDAWDSASLFHTSTGCMVIGDHNNQGFNAIKRVKVGMSAEIQYLDGNTDIYQCIAVVTGHNNGDYLTDADDNKLYDIYPDKLICYTCNDNWRNITIVVFDKV